MPIVQILSLLFLFFQKLSFTFLISCPCFLLGVSSPIFLFTNTFLSCLCSVIYPIRALYFNYHIFPNLYWRRQWHPTPVLLPGKSHGRRSLVGYSPWGREESVDWATSLSLFTFMHWRRKWQPTPVLLPGESQGFWEPGGLPSMGSHRVGHDWRDLAVQLDNYILLLFHIVSIFLSLLLFLLS